MTDINIKVPALEKLLDYTASGVGSVAGPMLAPWHAKRHAKAKQIKAQGDADALLLLANAQAEARGLLASENSSVVVDLNSTDLIHQRIEFQEAKRQSNIHSVVRQAAEQLGDTEVPDVEPDHDWTARFFNNVQDVSSKDMQMLWAKVLAAEVNNSGNIYIKTLDVLKNLDPVVAKLFQRLCSVSIYFYNQKNIMQFATACSLGRDATQNEMALYGLDFTALNHLEEFELITSDYNSIIPYTYGEGVTPVPFKFKNDFFVIVPSDNYVINTKAVLKIQGIVLTNSGRELATVVEPINVNDYALGLNTFIESKHLKMVKVEQ